MRHGGVAPHVLPGQNAWVLRRNAGQRRTDHRFGAQFAPGHHLRQSADRKIEEVVHRMFSGSAEIGCANLIVLAQRLRGALGHDTALAQHIALV
ncbi:hypothetical protein D9M69_401960 [compost metagenome]